MKARPEIHRMAKPIKTNREIKCTTAKISSLIVPCFKCFIMNTSSIQVPPIPKAKPAKWMNKMNDFKLIKYTSIF